MAQSNSMSKMAGKAGALIAIVGLLAFFAAVFSLVPRTFLLVGVALIVLSLAAFYAEELGHRKHG
jgi:xanthine/uracil permease